MKSDHLFAVVIFNHICIMLGAEIKCITKPQTSWLRNSPVGIVCFPQASWRNMVSTFGLTKHPTTTAVPQGFLTPF